MDKKSDAASDDNKFHEWDAALKCIADFDKTLMDLRKYGFTFLTGLITAQGFFGGSTSDSIRVAVILVTMVSVLVVFWLDKYYFSLLYGSYLRARFLEQIRFVNIRLEIFLGGTNNSKARVALLAIYFGFLFALLLLGVFAVTPITTTNTTNIKTIIDVSHGNTTITSTNSTMTVGDPIKSQPGFLEVLIAGFICSIVIIIATWYFLHHRMMSRGGKIIELYDGFEKKFVKEGKDTSEKSDKDKFEMEISHVISKINDKEFKKIIKPLQDIYAPKPSVTK